MYLGFVAALVTILLLCGMSFSLVTHVRYAQHTESLTRLTTYLIARDLTQNPETLNLIGRRFGVSVQVTGEALSSDSILPGYLIVEETHPDSMKVRAAFPGTVPVEITYHTAPDSAAFMSRYGEVTARSLLAGQAAETIAPLIRTLSGLSGYPLQLLSADAPSTAGLIRGPEGLSYQLPVGDGQQILRLGPVSAFSIWSWPALLVLALSALTLTGLGLYRSVISFETRLRKLQQATTRLAQGHLNARVSTHGQDQVSQLGGAFNKMAEHIQRLMDIQREMIRAVSHELRTPVARIRFAAQLIEDTVMDEPFVTKQLQGMDSDIQELDTLIDEILTYARLEEGGPVLDFQQVNVAEIAAQVVGEARPPKDVTTSYAGDDPVHFPSSEAEPRYVHRAIQNLVGNAGRYASSTVLVTCTVSDDICRVDVEDDGPGIPEEDWDRVFSAFARLDDSRTRASGGYGLGLSIVRRIMFWHGGRAMVNRSESLGGARFSLIWPRKHDDSEPDL
ncbi:MAG TPA: two-component sensor histidine kinase [Oceanospirillales bacterium]|nr:two-component sensor histidine kinase [Oceanospirillales bacterium]